MLLARQLNGGAGYTLPPATADTLGGVKIGDNINVTSDGTISTTVDTTLNSTSNNAIANSAVYNALASIEGDIEDINTDLVSEKTTAKADIVSITDAQDIPAEDVKADIEPIQDLHGYEYPWVGGAGKNLLPMTVDGIKSANTSGTWSGNVYTYNGVTFELLTDSANNVTEVQVNGTSSALTLFDVGGLSKLENNTSYIANNGGVATNTNYRAYLQVYDDSGKFNIAGSGTSFIYDTSTMTNYRVKIRVDSGASPSNVTFRPMIRLATVTDPTFAPYSNICPISGYTKCEVTRTGVNQWDEEVASGYYNANGEFVAGTNVASKNLIPCVGNTAYYFYGGTNTNSQYRLCFYDINQDFIERTTDSYVGTSFTTPINARYMTFYMELSPYGTTYNNDISVNYPSTITSYQAYQGQTYTVSFVDSQDASMTVYSGTLDVTTGVLVVDKAMVDLGACTWEYNSSGQGTMQSQSINTSIKKPSTFNDKIGLLSSAYVNLTGNQAYGGTIGIACIPNGNIWVHDPRYTDATAFKTAMDGVQLVYELATPQTYNLTPTQIDMLLNYNVVSASTGAIQVKYQPANTIGELKKLIYQLTS